MLSFLHFQFVISAPFISPVNLMRHNSISLPTMCVGLSTVGKLMRTALHWLISVTFSSTSAPVRLDHQEQARNFWRITRRWDFFLTDNFGNPIIQILYITLVKSCTSYITSWTVRGLHQDRLCSVRPVEPLVCEGNKSSVFSDKHIEAYYFLSMPTLRTAWGFKQHEFGWIQQQAWCSLGYTCMHKLLLLLN